MYKFTENQLEMAPYNLKHIPNYLSISISGTSYYPNPEKPGHCKYDNSCACYYYYNESALLYDYGEEACPECKNLLQSKPRVLKNGMLLYMSYKTLCYTNLPLELYKGRDYLWITQNNIGETVN